MAYDDYDGFETASKVFGVIGTIGGLFAGIALCDAFNTGINIGLILFSIIAGVWISIGIPYIWRYIVIFFKWWVDRCSGCLTFLIVLLINIYTSWSIQLGIIVVFVAPIAGVRFLIDEYREKKRRKKWEIERLEREIREKKEADAKAAQRLIEQKEAAERAKKKAEEDSIRKKRQSNATEIKNKARKTTEQCDSNSKVGKQINLQPEYKTIDLQENVWRLLNSISLQMQKHENNVNELKIGE